MICRIWNFVAFIGIVSTSKDDLSLRLVQFFAEHDILTEIGLIHVWICCSFSCLETFWIVCSRGEHWFMRTIFVLFDIASRSLLCENCFTCTTFETCVGLLYYLFAIRENSGCLRYVTIAILFVFGVYLFCGQ